MAIPQAAAWPLPCAWSREKPGTPHRSTMFLSEQPLETPAPPAPHPRSPAQTLASHHQLLLSAPLTCPGTSPPPRPGQPGCWPLWLPPLSAAAQTPRFGEGSPGCPQPSPLVPVELGFAEPPLPQAPHPHTSEKSRCLQGQAGGGRGSQTMRKKKRLEGGPGSCAGLPAWQSGGPERPAALGTPITPHTTSQNKRQSPQDGFGGRPVAPAPPPHCRSDVPLTLPMQAKDGDPNGPGWPDACPYLGLWPECWGQGRAGRAPLSPAARGLWLTGPRSSWLPQILSLDE